jgi:hypothetical protein
LLCNKIKLILFVQIFCSGTLRRYIGAVLQRNLWRTKDAI